VKSQINDKTIVVNSNFKEYAVMHELFLSIFKKIVFVVV